MPCFAFKGAGEDEREGRTARTADLRGTDGTPPPREPQLAIDKPDSRCYIRVRTFRVYILDKRIQVLIWSRYQYAFCASLFGVLNALLLRFAYFRRKNGLAVLQHSSP